MSYNHTCYNCEEPFLDDDLMEYILDNDGLSQPICENCGKDYFDNDDPTQPLSFIKELRIGYVPRK